jgi:hypothetical protein
MNAILRFWRHGAADADARVARALAPRRFDAADRYLRSSVVVQWLDRVTIGLHGLWQSSAARRAASGIDRLWSDRSRPARHRAAGALMLTAAVIHIALTLMQGARPGMYWLVVPGIVIALGVLFLLASRATDSTT